MCTVGHSAVSKNMYPPEGVCQYLFYVDVVIVDSKIVASLEQSSWNQFQMKAMVYKRVKSGIALDYRYTTSKLISDAEEDLNRLALNKIGSYGLLNIITKPSDLQRAVRAMKPVVAALKKIQGSDPVTRTVIAIGSYDYSGSGFMTQYKKIFEFVVK
ncbi:hypothetical protein HPB49_014428 [Dermacentor silvarum]|uniref:Uncharacterized protein n=1 Tax=Dermacentor silvarum TaxID=543639 RepID=A0ACB8D5R8_DERSI|nr:hypothetical protein HPB49_014428 [Dermacentor silvarum]